jgi:hypothetical protein
MSSQFTYYHTQAFISFIIKLLSQSAIFSGTALTPAEQQRAIALVQALSPLRNGYGLWDPYSDTQARYLTNLDTAITNAIGTLGYDAAIALISKAFTSMTTFIQTTTGMSSVYEQFPEGVDAILGTYAFMQG